MIFVVLFFFASWAQLILEFPGHRLFSTLSMFRALQQHYLVAILVVQFERIKETLTFKVECWFVASFKPEGDTMQVCWKPVSGIPHIFFVKREKPLTPKFLPEVVNCCKNQRQITPSGSTCLSVCVCVGFLAGKRQGFYLWNELSLSWGCSSQVPGLELAARSTLEPFVAREGFRRVQLRWVSPSRPQGAFFPTGSNLALGPGAARQHWWR